LRGEFYKELKKKEEDEFKEHTEKRVLNILENTVKFEAANFSAVNNTILDKALSALDTAVKGSNVQEESLQSSMAVLKNMGKGSKGGASDPLSTAVINALRDYSKELEGMSSADKDKMIALTQAQIDQIKTMDNTFQEN